MPRFLKISLWVILTLVLFVLAVIICAVKVLDSERLTPLVESIANRKLNADVSIGSVQLEFRSSYPFLNVEVDDVTILTPFERYDSTSTRPAEWPQWADTMLRVEKFKGGINIIDLFKDRVTLNDLEIVKPKVNLFVLNDSVDNFPVRSSKLEDEEEKSHRPFPDVCIKSFRIIDPQPIRFADASTDTHLTLHLEQASIDSSIDKNKIPRYRVRFGSQMESPLLGVFGLSDLPISFDGTLEWKHDLPHQLGLRDFKFAISELSGTTSMLLDFDDDIVIQECDMAINPISITNVLDILHKSQMSEYIKDFERLSTDATLMMDMHLNEPYTIGVSFLPEAVINIEVPDCKLAWQRVDLRHLALKIHAELQGNDVQRAVIDIERFLAAGPATTIELSGRMSELLFDPLYDFKIKGYVDLDQLPPAVTNLIGGTIRGTLSADASIKARQSMFSRENFHNLQIKGDMHGTNLYYIAPDTLQMYYGHKIDVFFGTNESVEHTMAHTNDTRTLDSLLTASITSDTLHMLFDDIRLDISDLQLGVGTPNKGEIADETAIIPLGGRLKVGALSLQTLSDSAGVNVRQMVGNVSMQRYKGDQHTPLFMFSTDIGRLSAGGNSTRFMVSNAHLGARFNHLPDSLMPPGRREIKKLADSLRHVHPDLTIDSVYILASDIHRRTHGRSHRHRVHGELTAQNTEVIDWGTSNGLQRLLLDWNIRGSLTADRAQLFTSAFPLRNRVRNLNITFNNDSLKLRNVEYKAGHSDFTLSGNISNIKQALTRRRTPQDLKVHIDMVSDTIDVNELAHAIFVGASATPHTLPSNLDTDDDISRHIDIADDETGPLLIPTNIDAEFNFVADNVFYSDLMLHDLKGTALMYNGAINIHDLSATSAVGDINLSALYAAPSVDDMRFGFGMTLDKFNLAHFVKLVPAIDTMMPMLHDFGGIINANIAATADVDSTMDLILPTLNAAVKLSGDSLVVIDEQTFKKISKWLLFKDKNRNMIDSMTVELTIHDGMMQLYPFVFNFDRYKLGVQGHNDLDMNFDYHVAVLKSPIPFKFGINIKGNYDHYKIRLGRSRFNEKQAINRVAFADTTRVNLVKQFENVFRRGVRKSRFEHLDMSRRPQAAEIDLDVDTLTSADSLYLQQEGLMPE